MTYTKENLDNYKKLNDELCQAQDTFTKRACEVFHRIFTEFLSKYEIASSDEETIEAACLDRLGIAKQQYHDRIETELDGKCVSIKVTGWYGDHDETSCAVSVAPIFILCQLKYKSLDGKFIIVPSKQCIFGFLIFFK